MSTQVRCVALELYTIEENRCIPNCIIFLEISTTEAKLGHSSPADRTELGGQILFYLPCRSYDQRGEPLARTLPEA